MRLVFTSEDILNNFHFSWNDDRILLNIFIKKLENVIKFIDYFIIDVRSSWC
jgi:hypothetical protein